MKLTQALFATAELCGTKLSEPAAEVLAQDLAEFDEAQVIAALARCRRELKGRLTVAEVLSRLDDGRPGPDEAWAMLTWDERNTCVVTPEMMTAQAAAKPLMDSGDKYNAKLAFKEVYVREINLARQNRKPAGWFSSLGWDKDGREAAIREAVALGRLSIEQAAIDVPEIGRESDALALPRPEVAEIIQTVAKRMGPK